MKSIVIALAWICLSLIGIGPVAAQDIPSVSFAAFPTALQRMHVYTIPGTPAGKAELHSPAPNDFPPCLVIGLETGREASAPGRYRMLSRNYLRIYNIIDVATAPYQTIQSPIERLKRLLKQRPPKSPTGAKNTDFNQGEKLPDYPPRNAGHLIETKINYLDAGWGSGIFYIAQFVQGAGEAPNNEALTYLFQGLSKDNRYFVSADFQISHPKVPAGPEDDPHDYDEAERLTYALQKTLDRESDNSFTPPLRSIREWVATMEIGGVRR